MSDVRAKSIRIEFEDGRVLWAEGDAAKELYAWLFDCQAVCCMHGATYTGPQFQVIPSGASA